jgi:hypothetical protein
MKKRPEKGKKKQASETMNKAIPNFKPRCTTLVCLTLKSALPNNIPPP